jgi:hypothetical protein
MFVNEYRLEIQFKKVRKVRNSGVKQRSKCASLLYLSTIWEKSTCNKVNFVWSTFAWNEVVLRSNVLLRYFHFVAKYFVTF